MDPLKTMIQDSCPEPLSAGPHRERLARLLRERRAQGRPDSWTTMRYALALTAGALCFALAILAQPRTPAPQSWSEERQLLTSLLPGAPAAAPDDAPAVRRARPMAEIKTAPAQNPGPLPRENQEAWDRVLQE